MEFAELILVPKLDGVIMHGPFHKAVDGTLCITGHHLILSSRKEGVEELWLLHQNIDAVERKPNGFLSGSIVIKCKDFRIIQLDINNYEDFSKVATSIERLSTLEDTTKLYPFWYRPMYTILEDGWTAFRPETEYSKLIVQSEDWRITYVNKDFTVCPSYPSAVLVPKSIDDETIIAAASFRQGGRFPVLSYKHEGGSILLRSSQPMVGPNSKRCREDERLLNSVLGPGKRGYIIDTRTQALAQTAKSKGGGFELDIHYPQWRRLHKPIDRHNGLLECLGKLVEACNDTATSMDRWLSRLESSNWMTHIKDALNCACLVAQCLDKEGASVLVHGSEGLDATLLVTSLAQVILNPDCRTIRGMEALVEREWVQAGYPFQTRHRRSCYAGSVTGGTTVSVGGVGAVVGGIKAPKGQQAPTFLLFLDCIAQVYSQFPCSFEFGHSFLILLFEHSYCSQFGTFLGDSEAERIKLQLSRRTVSLWSHLNRPEVLQSLLNPMYEPNNRVIWPSVAPMSLALWSELFLRWSVGGISAGGGKELWEASRNLREDEKSLRATAARLRKQLTDLEKEAIEVGILPPPKASPGATAAPAIGTPGQEGMPFSNEVSRTPTAPAS
ncbi:myotubularin-related protein 9 [Ischnura elegans]|uniref:myotubularin-related protein 9 n=1 Tax=Ischnura elegans TaxID=197161 RepID=UPI001ED89A8A|nr:myotubularin-related protein 9 [Ischnura elegans]XP_046393460.1 myotubularin-related protein 9 [Ischnura elegans]